MKKTPHLSPRSQAARAERDQRRARALRENLRRRKLQARASGDRAPGSGILSGGALSSTSAGGGEVPPE